MSAGLWACPKCKRQFGKKNQFHSCASYSVQDHFKDKPNNVKETFDLLIGKARKIGPVRIDAVKSLITLSGRYHFAAVYVKKSSLTIEFVLSRKISDQRIIKTQRMLSRYSHFFKLTSPLDVDEQVMDWLEQSYWLHNPAEDNAKPTLFKR